MSGLTNGASYRCTVLARNANGNGPASTPSAPVTPVGKPSAPRAVSASTKAGTLTVTWQAPTSTGGAAVSGYSVVCASTDGGATLTGSTGGTGRGLALPGLPDNRTYLCRVSAAGPGGTSPAGTSPYVMHAKITAASGAATMHLPVSSGQAVSALIRTSTLAVCAASVITRSPDGSLLGSACTNAATPAFIDASPVSGAGTATVVLGSDSGAAGTAELIGYVFRDVTATVSIGGAAVTTAITSPGQRSLLTFTGTAGQMITATITGNTIANGGVAILDPDGNFRGSVGLSGATAFIDTITLPTTGAYTVLVDPYNQNTGTLTVKLGNVPANTGSISIGGAPVTINLPVAGQNATRTFTGTAGQMITATITGNTIANGGVAILDPDGNFRGSVGLSGATAFIDTITLPTTGAYTVLVDPYNQNTGTLTVKLGNVPANTGSISIGGAPVTINLPVAGQNATRTFTGTAGQMITATITGNTIANGGVAILDPDGNFRGSVGLSGATAFIDTITLPTTGAYTVLVDPYNQNTGTLTVKLGNVPANTGSISIGGAPVTINLPVAGQNATRTFTGTAGQMITATITGNTIANGGVAILDPDGNYRGSVGLSGPTATIPGITLSSTGTYRVLVDPYNQETGKLTLKLHL